MESLAEVKRELKDEISSIKDSLINLKDENCGIDPISGKYSQTGKYEMKAQLEIQLENSLRFYELIKKVRKIR